MLSGRRSNLEEGSTPAARLPRPSGACGEALEPSGLAMTFAANFGDRTLD